MKRFEATELVLFLEALDACLEDVADIVVLGGAAAAIAYGASATTTDVDTFETQATSRERITRALPCARARCSVNPRLADAGIADPPYGYADRVERVLPHLARLRVFVLERHDLVLSKLVRGVEHDYQQIEQIHAHHRLDLGTLVDRYLAEMGAAIGRQRHRDLNLLECVERLFGELERVRVAAKHRLPRAS